MTTPDERPDLPPAQEAGAQVPPATPATPGMAPGTTPPPGADLRTTLEDSARAFDQRAQALGREAEAAVNRLGANPAVRDTVDVAGRIWGLVLLAFGLWFFADVTLRWNLPSVAWDQLWPVILIVLGGLVVVRGMARRS